MNDEGWVVRTLTATLVLLSTSAVPVWAAQDTATASVSATLPLRATLELTRDDNSVTRGSATTIRFDRVDDADVGVENPNPLFMYAPYRSEEGKNWHLADIVATGSSMTLTANVTGTAGGVNLSDIMDVFMGGFFHLNESGKGGKSTDWELLDTFERTLNEPFIGIAPFNYRLRIEQAPAGTYSGVVTYTLVSN